MQSLNNYHMKKSIPLFLACATLVSFAFVPLLKRPNKSMLLLMLARILILEQLLVQVTEN
jgi:hypothetical protein